VLYLAVATGSLEMVKVLVEELDGIDFQEGISFKKKIKQEIYEKNEVY